MQAPPVNEPQNGEAMNVVTIGNEGVARSERLLTEPILHGNLRRFAETALGISASILNLLARRVTS
jgi:hypothetical protein